MRKISISAATVLALSIVSCSSSDSDLYSSPTKVSIEATAADAASSRTSIHNGSADTPAFFGVLWNPGDIIGVFSADGSENSPLTYNGSANTKNATFSGTKSGTPAYAYYPYSPTAGTDPRALTLSLAAEQPATATHTLTGDYKIGTPKAGYTNRFTFSSVLSLGRICVNTAGVADMEGEELRSVSMTVEGRSIVGKFKLNTTAEPAAAAYGFEGGNTITVSFPGGTKAAGRNYAFVSFFPTVKDGDAITFTVETTTKKATVKLHAAADFAAGSVYSLPLTATFLNDPDKTEIVDNGNGEQPDPIDPTVTTGTFTCATYNVDGLPSLVNSDGPGKNGTTTLGQKVNSENKWDFFCVSEDFEYDSQLTSALTNYNHGTYRGSVGLGQAFGSVADTDGLNMFWKKNTGIICTNETYVEYKDKEGNLYNGANECIKKGFRYYLVTLADGTEIDVYITHMNTFSGSDISESNKYVAAVHSQLKQVRDYMIQNMQKNHRPAIFMGDTNMRYTRHKLQEYFMDYVNGMDGYSLFDPWCSVAWNSDFSAYGGGLYPAYNSKSLMVSDATGTDAKTDIIISEAGGGLQKGEVVDKVFYINHKDNKTQLTAKSYLRDVSYKKSDGKPLADHYPTVVNFEYTTTK